MRVVTAGLLAVAGTVGTAAAASAAPCPAGLMCGWGDRYYKTGGSGAAWVKAYQCQNDLADNNYEGTTRRAQDDITSVYNNGNTYNGYYYTASWYAGTALFVARGTGYDQLNASHPAMNDTISSFKFTGAPGTCV